MSATAASVPSWDILIATLEERHHFLCGLLMLLSAQIVPGVRVRIFRDNMEMRVGEKRQALIESSRASYVSFIDDDDLVAYNYVSAIREALRQRPDYVGFKVLWTTDGMPERPVYHSLIHGDWFARSEGLYRDLSHLNPIRRTLAKKVSFEGGNSEDHRWASELRKLQCVRSEVFIDQELYHYRYRTADCHLTTRQPTEFFHELPSHPFVTWVTP